jgi:small-conductance mechanosensitive channel
MPRSRAGPHSFALLELVAMNELKNILDPVFFGNTLWQWTFAGLIAFVVLSTLLAVRRIIRSQYERLAATPQTEIMEVPLKVASRTTVLFILVAALFAGLQAVELPPKLARLALTLFTISAFWQAGLWATTAVLASLERKAQREMAVNRAAAGTLGVIGFIARVTIWAFVLLLTLDNLGIEIKPLLAGLGIGGIAVALAAQNVLGDLFASLAITLDRPFVVGDALAVDDFSGTVEYIGVKSTRLRSVNGEQIIMPNSNLMNSRMRNHSRLRERRVVLTISVSHDTSAEKLAGIPALIRQLIEAQSDTRLDRAHLAKVGTASFDFEAVYFVTIPDYNRHMDIQQTIVLRLLEAFERDDIAIADSRPRLSLEGLRTLQAELVDREIADTARAARDSQR